MMKKLFALFAIIAFSAINGKAQDIPAKIKQATWFRIMSNDSSYNYLQAETEFQKFYASYQKEKIKESKRAERNKTSSEEQHLESPMELLVADYFKWSVSIQPFVLADGRIMPFAQRLSIIKETKLKQQAQQ